MTSPQIGDVWYRYEEVTYAPALDEYDEPSGPSTTKIRRIRLVVTAVTPKGVYVRVFYGKVPSPEDIPHRILGEPRLVCHHWTKKYAHPTMKLALQALVARKTKQRSIYQARIEELDKILKIVEKKEDKLLSETQFSVEVGQWTL